MNASHAIVGGEIAQFKRRRQTFGNCRWYLMLQRAEATKLDWSFFEGRLDGCADAQLSSAREIMVSFAVGFPPFPSNALPNEGMGFT